MHWLNAGGPVIWILLMISVVVVALIIERFLVIWRLRLPALRIDASPEAVRRAMSDPGWSEFLSAFSALPFREENVLLAGRGVLSRMRTRLGVLSTLAKAATLLGLLGTILGMMDAFSVIAAGRSGLDMALLAKGLEEALITTAAGLIVALPAMIAAALFEGIVTQTAQRMTVASSILGREQKALESGS